MLSALQPALPRRRRERSACAQPRRCESAHAHACVKHAGLVIAPLSFAPFQFTFLPLVFLFLLLPCFSPPLPQTTFLSVLWLCRLSFSLATAWSVCAAAAPCHLARRELLLVWRGTGAVFRCSLTNPFSAATHFAEGSVLCTHVCALHENLLNEWLLLILPPAPLCCLSRMCRCRHARGFTVQWWTLVNVTTRAGRVAKRASSQRKCVLVNVRALVNVCALRVWLWLYL